MLYYITYTHIPTKKAFGYAIARMCSSFAEHEQVTLVIPKNNHREIDEDIWTFYNVPRNFSVIELPCVDVFRYTFLGTHVPFLIRKLTFALSVAFRLRISKDAVCYSRDIWSLLFLRCKTTRVFLEIHYLSKIDAISVRLAHIARNIIVITSYLKKELMDLGYSSERILVAPDAVDLSEYEHIQGSRVESRMHCGLPPQGNIVLYSGNLFAWKGVYTLVDAFETLPNALLVIVGGSDDVLPAFKEYVASKPYAERITVVGFKKHQEIAAYLTSADALVIPNSAKEHISKYNTSPLKLFEYMASGVPIVASDLPSMREVIGEKEAFFFEADNVRSLADTIAMVLERRDEASVRAQAALKKVQNYSWTARARSILSFIHARAV
jgi:glycosyltransferase involved in cell wall biosynthesis